jgi:hypothetical protein
VPLKISPKRMEARLTPRFLVFLNPSFFYHKFIPQDFPFSSIFVACGFNYFLKSNELPFFIAFSVAMTKLTLPK